jgi:hypothetical protein
MSKPETSVRMRPVFRWTTEGSSEEFVDRLEQVASFDPAVRIQRGRGHAMLSIPDEARHTWSPTLDIQVSDHPAGAYIFARVSPAPEVWTLFVFCYAATSAVTIFGTVLGWSQHIIGASPWGLWALPIGLLICGGLYAASFVGRGLGAHQIHQILAVVEASLGIEGKAVE